MDKQTKAAVTSMDRKKGIMADYEAIILGKRKTFSSWYFTDDKVANSKLALIPFKYAFETILHWSAQDIYEKASREVFVQMHLWSLWKNRIILPEGMQNKFAGQRYIVYLLYPKKYKRDIRADTLTEYQELLAERKRTGKNVKVAKNFFDGNDGKVKAAICLQYIINENMQVSSVDALYEIFSDGKIRSELEKYSLWMPCTRFFQTPVDYLHYSLPEEYQCEDSYNYAKRKYLRNRIRLASSSESVKAWKESFCKVVPRKTHLFYDPLGNVKADAFSECFYYFIKHILPTEASVAEYEPTTPSGLCDVFMSDDIDHLLDKYQLLAPAREISANYIELLDQTLPPEDKDMLLLEYAKKQYAKRERGKYSPMHGVIRAYSCALATAPKQNEIWGEEIKKLTSVDYERCIRYFGKKKLRDSDYGKLSEKELRKRLTSSRTEYENFMRMSKLYRPVKDRMEPGEFVDALFGER